MKTNSNPKLLDRSKAPIYKKVRYDPYAKEVAKDEQLVSVPLKIPFKDPKDHTRTIPEFERKFLRKGEKLVTVSNFLTPLKNSFDQVAPFGSIILASNGAEFEGENTPILPPNRSFEIN